MSEQEARKVFSHVWALCKVLGGDVRKLCAERGLSDELVEKFLDEQRVWDAGLSKFDWDGSVKKTKPGEQCHSR
jgi:hypothetical protein